MNFGQTGVDLFFVLSGFLITSILLSARQHDWDEIRTFYVRRTLRIFPLYYGFLLLCAACGAVDSWPYWVYLQNFWLSLHLPLTGPPHFWSLAVEEQFYLVWPFLVLFCPRRRLLAILWAMIVGAFCFRFFLARAHYDVFGLTFTRIDGLAAGAVLAVLHSRESLARWRNLLLALMLLSMVVLVIASVLYRRQDNPWFLASKYSLIVGIYAGLVGWLLCSPDSSASAAFSARPLRFIGRISYGLYIVHPYIFLYVFSRLHGHSAWLKGLVGCSLTLLAALLSWYGFERHFIKLKSRWAPEPRFTPQAPVDA